MTLDTLISIKHTQALNNDNHTAGQVWLAAGTLIPLLSHDLFIDLFSDPS